MIRALAIIVALAYAACAHAEPVRVGSKLFTESVILGDIATLLARDAGADAEHQREFGGTRVLFSALGRGDIHIYPEYTGTITQEILSGEGVSSFEGMRAALAERGIGITEPLGFNNTYAIGVMPARAEQLGLRTVSDLRAHPELRFGFSNEFLDRGDGWPALQRAYDIPQSSVQGLDHQLAYRGLVEGSLDAIDLYSTDAEIGAFGIAVLEDDRAHFPRYDAVYLYRLDLDAQVIASLERLEGRIDEPTMIALNERSRIERVAEPVVASEFLEQSLDIESDVQTRTRVQRIARRTVEHLLLVAVSLGAAMLVAVPLGVLAAKSRALGSLVLALTGILLTIPSLALLVFMIPLLGTGSEPAIAALFLYSLLPIVRNTHAGIVGISRAYRESALALGLSPGARLLRIELPLASPSVLAGIKTAAVLNIGFATLGAFIGAGGYGQPILTGLRLDRLDLILEGAIPAAMLAILVQTLFGAIERLVVPRGLRGAQSP